MMYSLTYLVLDIYIHISNKGQNEGIPFQVKLGEIYVMKIECMEETVEVFTHSVYAERRSGEKLLSCKKRIA